MVTATEYSTTGIALIPQRLAPALAASACATVLCTELRGYARLAQRLHPAQFVPCLNEYHAILTGAVLSCGGEIFHLVGAGMMSGFGVRDPRQTHTVEALAAACMILQQFAPLSAHWQHEYKTDAGVGIGLHRGEVAFAVFGPPGHEAPTLVGDVVNVAAGLCSRARAGEVLFSAALHPHRGSSSSDAGEGESMRLLHLPKLALRERDVPLDTWCIPLQQRPTAAH